MYNVPVLGPVQRSLVNDFVVFLQILSD